MLAVAALLSATAVLAQEADSTEEGATSGIDWSVGLRGSYAASTLTGGNATLALT